MYLSLMQYKINIEAPQGKVVLVQETSGGACVQVDKEKTERFTSCLMSSKMLCEELPAWGSGGAEYANMRILRQAQKYNSKNRWSRRRYKTQKQPEKPAHLPVHEKKLMFCLREILQVQSYQCQPFEVSSKSANKVTIENKCVAMSAGASVN